MTIHFGRYFFFIERGLCETKFVSTVPFYCKYENFIEFSWISFIHSRYIWLICKKKHEDNSAKMSAMNYENMCNSTADKEITNSDSPLWVISMKIGAVHMNLPSVRWIELQHSAPAIRYNVDCDVSAGKHMLQHPTPIFVCIIFIPFGVYYCGIPSWCSKKKK